MLMMRRALSWLGLLLIAGSLAWLYFLPAPVQPIASRPVAPPKSAEPFSIVVLDAGHGGTDSGALVDGVAEKDLTLDVVFRAERLLRAHGLQIVLTRDRDASVSLASRAATANRERDCIFVSIHFNHEKKETISGVETYYALRQAGRSPSYWSWLPFLQKASAAPANSESQSLAAFIQESLVAHTQATNRGTKPEQFFVISNVWHPAVLVEGGFLTNKSDVSKLGTDEYREQIAVSITEGVIRYRDLVNRTPAAVAMAGAVPE
jgi:N-acetylmuramoyl-L-alanine amidase